MDTSHWSQGSNNNNNNNNNNNINIGVVKPMEDINSSSMIERRTKPPQKDQTLNCPRCNSTNTKFCYYNNYSLSQPRYICKTCRRYWTEGGSLRNVPVGGGSRKNKRSSTTTSSSNNNNNIIISSTPSPSSNSTKKIAHHHDLINPSLNFPQSASQNPKIQQGQDLNLAYPPTDQDNNINFETFSRLVEVPNYQKVPGSSSSTTTTTSHVSAMELLKSAGIGSRVGLMSSFMPMSSMVQDSNAIFSNGLIPNLPEFKPNLNFGLDGFESGYGVGDNCNNARLLFPTNEDMKQQVSSTSTTTEFINDHHHQQINRGQGGTNNSAGYWNGMLGGGSW